MTRLKNVEHALTGMVGQEETLSNLGEDIKKAGETCYFQHQQDERGTGAVTTGKKESQQEETNENTADDASSQGEGVLQSIRTAVSDHESDDAAEESEDEQALLDAAAIAEREHYAAQDGAPGDAEMRG
eukprot:7240555-Heterocapsa_arctica.AAC.1